MYFEMDGAPKFQCDRRIHKMHLLVNLRLSIQRFIITHIYVKPIYLNIHETKITRTHSTEYFIGPTGRLNNDFCAWKLFRMATEQTIFIAVIVVVLL